MWYPVGMNRRHFLRHLAGYSLMALPGWQFLQTIQANAQQMQRNNKSLIIMWMGGGPATIDIWDLKPGRPTGGEFQTIDTTADGVQICEHMPRTAQQMRHLTIIRSLTTTEGDHNRGTTLMHTGRTPNPAMQFPSIGAVMAKQADTLPGYHPTTLPTYLTVGGGRGADGPGFLGMTFAPFNVQNPGQPPENLQARGLPGNANDALNRIHRRQRLFYDIENGFVAEQATHLFSPNDRAQFADASLAHRDTYKKGFSLVANKDGNVFNFKSESQPILNSYGNTPFGRSALLARRLVEAGVSAVEINLGNWDTHGQNFQALKTRQLPPLDQGMSALVKDLVDRGMWQNTVVLWMGEFGRTPRINQNAGRDHWARCWSVVVGGGAIRGGQAYGATDADGMSVARDPVRVGDVFATVYRALGIDPTTQIRDPIGRPFSIAGDGGRPISALF
jgi:Protein of unknown function (DUF1501)